MIRLCSSRPADPREGARRPPYAGTARALAPAFAPACAPVVALVIALVMALASPGVARADGFNCGNRVITTGMELYEVREACGEPAQVTRTTILRRPVIWRHGRPYYASEDFVPVPAETWIYDFGSMRLMRKLRFVDGELTDIETLGYGGHAPSP